MRYFRASLSVYEGIRAQLDAAYGYPNADTKTVTAITPAEDAAKDENGRVLLLASDAECEFPVAAAMLPQLLASGAVEEIDAATYQAALPQTP